MLLSEPGRDFEGGEFMLVEQRPRMQSRGEVVPLQQGDAVLFAVNERPAKGTPRLASHGDAPRRLQPAQRRALHARHHLPRRGVTVQPTRDREDLRPEFGDAEAGLAAGRQHLGMGGAVLARHRFGRGDGARHVAPA